MTGHAFDSKGNLWFVGWNSSEQRVGRVSAEGTLSYFALSPQQGDISGVVDAQDRYLIAHTVHNTTGVLVSLFSNEGLATLAGQSIEGPLQDGKGPTARIRSFESPLLASDGLVYFLDRPSNASGYTLRAVSQDGTVTSVLPVPDNSRLVASATGAVRRFTDDVPNSRVEWAELTLSPLGGYSWTVLSHSWQGVGHPEPFAPVKGAVDTYWAFDSASNTLAHYALDGTRSDIWPMPGWVSTAVSNPTNGNLVASGSAEPEGAQTTESPGVLFVLDRMKGANAVARPWVGLSEQRGYVDGTGGAARFDFVRGAYATSDASGPIYVATLAEIPLQGTPPNRTTPTPLRVITPEGQVTSLSSTFSSGYQHLANAYGYLVTHNPANNTLLRTSKSAGNSAWESWVTSPLFAGVSGLKVLRTDSTGLLWFATRTLPFVLDSRPYGSGTSLIGTVSASGQVQVVVGDPQLIHTADSYPPLDQRPWYMDVTDIAFEGGSSTVWWVLCNRRVLSEDRTRLVGSVPELVRLEGNNRQSFALPSANVQSFISGHYHQLCTLPSRPGEVFLSSACGVYRWTVAKGLELLAGQNQPTPVGVRLGALPASLNLVKFISPGPDANSLYVGSENSVLRLNLPA